ncbi:MAG: hypothetical protein J6C77_07060, partial [Muribaculaceae bacterium]|nr:hypothetical protein [Muribaculaceae bacterium]
ATGYAPVAEIAIDSNGLFLNGRIHSFIQKSGVGPRADSTNAAAKLMRSLSLEDFPASPLIISSDGTLSIRQAD